MSLSRGNARQSVPVTQPSTQDIGFQQQGSVDWTAVASGTVSFSVKVLSQLSKAGVEALTICAARAMFRDVRLGNNGELRLQRALKNLSAFPSIDKVLWFGFGVRHIIWHMQESAEGLACLAICSSLTESYTTAAAAKVMKELFLVYNPPSELTPALSQWQALVEACEGILAPTEFGLVLHGLIKLFPRDGLSDMRACAPPRDVATVLRKLFQVSAGHIDRLYLSGGADCAWIAAVAHWLLDLRVEILDQDGTTIYRPDGTRSQLFPDAQVIVAYTQGADEPHVPLQVLQKRYVIPSGHKLLVGHPSEEDYTLSYGRVSWDTCLVDTFGSQMELLLGSQARTAGACLGSAARILSAVMSEPMSTPEPNLRSFKPPVSSSAYGRGFYLLARRQFAELDQTTPLVQKMETALHQSYLEAAQQLSQSFTKLGRLCLCRDCDSNAGISVTEDHPVCLIILVQTICILVRIMSVCYMQQDLDVHPTRCGIENIYRILRSQRFAYAEDLECDPSETALLWSWTQHDSLTWMQILFTGREDKSLYTIPRGNSVVATCNGLCFCLNTLTEITSDPQRACMILVIPGKIEWHDFIYHRIRDLEPGHRDPQIACGGPYNAVSSTIINQYDDLADSSSADLNAELIVEETTAERRLLQTTYRITTPESPGKSFLVGPRMIWGELNEAFTAASCQGGICRSLNGFQSILVKGEGLPYPVLELRETQLPITCVLSSQDLAIWVALSQTHLLSSDYRSMKLSHILQGEQCIRCCVLKSKECQRAPNTYGVALITSI